MEQTRSRVKAYCRGKESAFPVASDVTESGNGISSIVGDDTGLTKREFLAANAHQALIGNPLHKYSVDECAERAVIHADALLEVLSR